MLGPEERLIRKLKATAERLLRELNNITAEDAFRLAVHAHNSTVQPSTGFAPFQWSRGGITESVPVGIDPNKAFEKLLKQREVAGVAYRNAVASEHLSKLNNSVGRPRTSYEPGSLVMLWRARKNAGRGAWTGPVRVIHMEGSTIWMASGATLLRAKLNQIRPCSRTEELAAVASGASVYKMPTTMETLLRGFRGRFYEDLTGNNPPQGAQEDTSQGEVRSAPRPRRPGEDRWEIRGPWLIRVHVKPRLGLFVPSRTKERTMPVPAEELEGERVTFVRVSGNLQGIRDNFLREEAPARCLPERWTGETHFRIKPEHPQGRAEDKTQALPQPLDPTLQPPVPPQEPRAQSSQEPSSGRGRGLPGASVGRSERQRSRSQRPPVPHQEPAQSSQEPSSGRVPDVPSTSGTLVPPTPVSAMPGTCAPYSFVSDAWYP